jgi:hypothetical protein
MSRAGYATTTRLPGNRAIPAAGLPHHRSGESWVGDPTGPCTRAEHADVPDADLTDDEEEPLGAMRSMSTVDLRAAFDGDDYRAEPVEDIPEERKKKTS